MMLAVAMSFMLADISLDRLDNEKRTARTHDVFADPRCARCSYFSVDIESASEDGTISNPTCQLVRQSAGGTTARKMTVGIQTDQSDGVMVRGCCARCRLFGLPFFPFLPLLVRE